MDAEGGERDPLIYHTENRDDDEVNETTGFGPGPPGASSTPATRQTTLNQPHAQTSYSEFFPDAPAPSTASFAENELRKEFPNFKRNEIKARIDKGRLEVGLMKPNKPYIRLLTQKRVDGEYQINKKLPKEVLRALGESRREMVEKEIKSLAEEIQTNKEEENSNPNETERKKARDRAKRQIEKRTALTRELEQLKKGTDSQPSESIELEDFQKNEEVRREREQEIQLEIEKQEEIVNDDNRPSVERERAKANKKDLQQEQNEIENERERDMEQLPLSDRLREKVKTVFKKYGFTVTAVFLAVGTTIGVILSSLSSGLKAVTNGVGNGLQTLGKKIANILPGLLGAVVSFVFRTAGKVISFLGKHAWLLILAVAAFLFERLMKRRD